MHKFPYSLNELNFTSITSQAMQLDVQGKTSNRFALSWLYSFSMPWCPIGMTIEEWYCSFIPFEGAWREPRPRAAGTVLLELPSSYSIQGVFLRDSN